MLTMMVTMLSHPPVVHSLEDLLDFRCALGHKSLSYALKNRWSIVPGGSTGPSLWHFCLS
jgi:hypothetical protein